MKDIILMILSILGGFIGWFLGDVNGLIYTLIAFVMCDYITGVMVAIINKKLSSEVGFKGIFRKVLIFILVGCGNLLDVYFITEGSVMRTAVIFFYLSNEGISLLENVGNIGLPFPQKLKKLLVQLNEREVEEE